MKPARALDESREDPGSVMIKEAREKRSWTSHGEFRDRTAQS
jgi:hypothetical protein